MALTSVDTKLRPIRFAFLIDLGKKGSLLEAIQISTFLWGGRFCPIIPVTTRLPKAWKKNDPYSRFSAKKIFDGYIDAYDPDFLISIGGVKPPSGSSAEKIEIINASELMRDAETEGGPQYGIGFFEVLNEFIEKELKFARVHPITVNFPVLDKKFEVFLASVIGQLPAKIDGILRKNFKDYIGALELGFDIKNYLEVFKRDTFFPRSIGTLFLEFSRPRAFREGQCVFLMDAKNPLDIIDYWNLRAAGWSILPVATQSMDEAPVIKQAEDFIKAHFGQSRHNPKIYYCAAVMKGRSVPSDTIEKFAKKLSLKHPSGEHMFVINSHYPRIWDEWAREKDGAERCQVWAKEEEHELGDVPDQISVKKLTPDFFDGRYSGNPRFANEVQVRSYGEAEPIAEVIPEGDKSLARVIEGVGIGDWRFSKDGMVYFADSSRGKIRFEMPRAEAVFTEWLKGRGIDAQLSSPGKITKQIVKQLGGANSLSIFSHAKIIEMLGGIAGGKVLPQGELERVLNQVVASKRFAFGDKDRIKRRLVESGILVLGAQVQCSACSQRSWYSIKELDYEVRCKNCGDVHPLPSESPKKIDWAYRAGGLFDLPGGAYGSYATLLVLRFFIQLLHGSTTPMPSFEYADNKGRRHEVDLGLFFRRSNYDKTTPDLVFVECKGLGEEFSKKDIDGMRVLAAKFPGSILAFATLRNSLTAREKRLLKPFVNKGRRYWKSEKAYNPVLILTGIELFSDWDPAHSWKDAGNPYAALSDRARYIRELQELCDLSQQLHLGMKPWHDWLQEKWDRKKSARLQRQRLKSPPSPGVQSV